MLGNSPEEIKVIKRNSDWSDYREQKVHGDRERSMLSASHTRDSGMVLVLPLLLGALGAVAASKDP